jgi:hypothetical protein
VAVAAFDEQAEALLETVRRLSPPQLLRLAGLWAGVSYGSLDPHRQRRRNGARIALRYLADEDRDREQDGRSAAAAAAVLQAFGGDGTRGARSLRGPAADATFAVADALDALAYGDRLTSVAFEELMRPWNELMDQRRFEEEVATE